MIGKNASIADMITFEVIPKPNQITNSGISATLGTTCEATMSGRRVRSSHGTLPSTTPTATPHTTAIRNPLIVSVAVTWACDHVSGSLTTSTRLARTVSGGGSTSSEIPNARTNRSQA